MTLGIGVLGERVARAAAIRRGSWPLALLCFALGGLAWAVHHAGIPWRLVAGDAFEYAEMARRLVAGEGFTTGVIFPAELWLGSDPGHPAVTRPPLWPLVLAGPFAVLGASDAVAHAVVGLAFAAMVATAAALATRCAGRVAGAVTAVAVATQPWLLLLSLDAIAETFFALTLTLAFWLLSRRAPPLVLGMVCGLAYLARYNGAVLLPAMLGLLWWRGAGVRGLAICAAGFVALAAPWWVRNWAVAGDPFYSLLNWNLYIAPLMTKVGGSLLFHPEPDLASGVAIDPLEKARQQLPLLLSHLPLVAANPLAFLGVALACFRRDGLAWCFAALALATFGVVTVALALGRYFVPLLPVLLALGAVGWWNHGGRFRGPALALLLLAPWLPSLSPLPDLSLVARQAAGMREGRFLPPPPDAAVAACLDGPGRARILAEEAARLVWQHDVVAIYAPVRPAFVARILDEHPIGRAYLPDARRVPPGRLAPTPECGDGWYAPLRP